MTQPGTVTQFCDASFHRKVRAEARNLEDGQSRTARSQDAEDGSPSEPISGSVRESTLRGEIKGQITKDRRGNSCDDVTPNGSPCFIAIMSQAQQSYRQVDGDSETTLPFWPGSEGTVPTGLEEIRKSILSTSTGASFETGAAIPDEVPYDGGDVPFGVMLSHVGTVAATDPSEQSIEIRPNEPPDGTLLSDAVISSEHGAALVPTNVEQSKSGNNFQPFRDLGFAHNDIFSFPRFQFDTRETLSGSELKQETRYLEPDSVRKSHQGIFDETNIELEKSETHRASGMFSGSVSAAFWRLSDLAAVQYQTLPSSIGAATDLELNSPFDRLGGVAKSEDVEERFAMQNVSSPRGADDGDFGAKDNRGEATPKEKYESQAEDAIKTSIQGRTNGTMTSLVHGLAPGLQVGKEILTQLTSVLPAQEAIRDNHPHSLTGGQTVRILEITLEPKDLGAVRVRLNLKDSVLNVEMSASKVSTVQLLESDIEALGRQLTEAGYEVAGVSIGITTPDANSGRVPYLATTAEHSNSHAPGLRHDGSSFGSAPRNADQFLTKSSETRDGGEVQPGSPQRAVDSIPGKSRTIYI
jgi:Flagellar hook-length control protein FliK